MKKRYMLCILFALFCLPGLGFAEETLYPQRIISLGPAITEQLYLLGVEERVVGVTTYCREGQEKAKIGTVIDVDIETVTRLQPDLVLATALTNPKTIKKLKNLGIKVEDFTYARNFDELCAQFIELGTMVGKSAYAQEIVERAMQKVNDIKEKTNNLPKVKVLVQVGANPLFAATPDSFINDTIRFAGGINVVSGTKTGLYSKEKVLEDNPEVIVIIRMGIGGEQEKQVWQKYKTLQAVQDERIYVVDDYLYGSPTPVTFVEGLQQMVKMLH